MSNAAGTLESIAIELSKILGPLEYELATPSRAKTFLMQMGFKLTDAQVAGIAVPLSAAATNASNLVGIVENLITAIEAEDFGPITQKSIEAIQNIVGIINALTTLGPQIGGLVGVPANEVAKRLFDSLLFNYLDRTKEFNDTLELIGLLDRADHNEDSEDPNNPPFTIVTYRFDQIGGWFSNPANQLRTLYDWGNNFDGRKLFSRIENILARNGLPVIYDDSGVTPRLDIVFLEIVPKTDVTPHGLLIRIKNSISPGTQVLPLGNDAKLELKIDFQVPANMGLSILPNGIINFVPSVPGASFAGDFIVKIMAEQTLPPAPFILFGQSGGSRLELRKFTLTTGTKLAWDGSKANGDFMFEGDAHDLKVIINASKGDGFLAKILPGTDIEAEFSVQIGISTEHGFYFNGSGALEVRLPTHIDLGPIAFEALTIAAKLDKGKIPVSVGADLRATLGPLIAVVENMGVITTFSFPPGNSGNLGPLQFDLGFKPPNGVGLSLDAGVVKGGGYLYFDFDREEYAGVLELSIANIVTVKAIGLITTKMPDGSKGFSLLIIITAEFGTGIQLGFGFTLIGLGGLLGLNRTMNLPPLMEGVRTGAINSIMFPANPVANAPRIISDLRLIFPPYVGKFLIGPMAKLGWGTPTLVSVSLGVIIEIPGNIAILGVLKIALPAEEAPLIVIQVNFAGAIEFDKKRLYFFATLFESRVLFLTIEGDMGLLVAWGDDANFVVSVGGFHPRFNPPPLPFPNPRRIAIDILNTPVYRIRSEGYFAVTSNTVQFGSSTELMIDVGVAQIQGHINFDALFQFSPFYFIIEISAGVSFKVFGIGLFSISLQFALEGPAPWRAHGTGTLSLFFFDVSADFDVTWGDSQDTTLPPISVMPLLKIEFEKQENWKAELPVGNNLLVSLRKLSESESAQVLHPLGTLRVSQRAVPLDIKIDKVGSRKPSDANQLKVTPTGDLTKVTDAVEQFAKAQFITMSDADKLSQRAFDPLHGGVLMASGAQTLGSAKLVKRKVRYEQIIIDNNFKRFRHRFIFLTVGFFTHFLNGSAITKSALSKSYRSQIDPFTEKVQLKEGGFTVALTENNQAYSTQAMHFSSETLAHQYIQEQVSLRPELHEALHVIPQHEVSMAA